ncbi:uncharacterized protein LOC129765530 [Toxorhynchites rutilus septentrionalis]|uniref:uncharacterized protein LOC129765530 n=1 Tax=Toxorhynchites rutilus septentrionalis TaxID=329112 RepID=UPI00247955A2|nr:uncharacterized protein LOC129765530 [Toxorhynchites rutilus septentrionalis]
MFQEDQGSEEYESGSDSPRPADQFVTVRKTEKMVKTPDEGQEAAQLREELAAKVAEITQLQQRLALTTSSHVRAVDRRPDFRELRELVSKFDPKQATCLSAEEWIEEIETTAEHYGWDGPTKLHCARLNLEGSAKLWWTGVQNEVATWALFSAKLTRANPSDRDPIYYHTQMNKRRKLRDETIEEYVYSQVALGKRAGFDEGVIVKYVIAGLGEFASKSRVHLGGRIETVEELISQLKWMESMNSTPTDLVGVCVPERKKEKVVACYRCRQTGHKAISCPTVPERCCYNCGVSGHMAKNCPNPKPPKAGPSRMQVVDEENNFVRVVELGDMQLTALIDSGCKVSTIQSRFAEKVGNIETTNTTLVGFGGKKVNVDQIVRTVVRLDDIEVPVKLNVVPNWAQSTALILGRDMLNTDGLIMVNRKGKVAFRLDQEQHTVHEQMVVEVRPRKYETMFTIDSQVPHSKIGEEEINADGPKKEILVLVNQFRSCFATNMRELGVAKGTKMKIVLSDKEPVYIKPHRMEYARETALRGIVEELIDAGIVTESNSPYSSRVVMVPKKDGTFRMAVDYRLLNKKTVKDRYPMPDIEWCLNKLSGAEMFITVDLYSVYYQIPEAEDSQECTAFSTRDGHYHFLRMRLD